MSKSLTNFVSKMFKILEASCQFGYYSSTTVCNLDSAKFKNFEAYAYSGDYLIRNGSVKFGVPGFEKFLSDSISESSSTFSKV